MDQSLVGRKAEPFEVIVELGKVREFARATRSDNPEYVERRDAVTPPTFLMAAHFWRGPENSEWGPDGLDFTNVLHGEQEFTFYGPPPHVGDRLIGQARVDRMYEKAGGRGGSMIFTDTVCEYRNEAGDLVAEVKSTNIRTSKAAVAGDAS